MAPPAQAVPCPTHSLPLVLLSAGAAPDDAAGGPGRDSSHRAELHPPGPLVGCCSVYLNPDGTPLLGLWDRAGECCVILTAVDRLCSIERSSHLTF